MTLGDDLAFAHRLADAADAITTARYRSDDLVVEAKPDLSPVTDADRAVEREIRWAVETERRGEAVLGEEFGGPVDGLRWVVDPIDSTKNFVRGVPVWATLVALLDDAEPRVAVVSAPALGRRWWAARGEGAAVRDPDGATRACRVSAVADPRDAMLSYSSLSGWRERGRLTGFRRLTEAVWRTRGLGDFWSYLLVAEGAVDIACEVDVSLWDLAAPALVVEEAGGRFTDLDGRRGPAGGAALATNGRLHDAALALLAPD